MISPLDYWPSDPQGFLRHIIIGAILTLSLMKIDDKVTFVIILFVALSKEFADAVWLDSFWSWMDVAMTLSSFLFIKTYRCLKES